jgi:hypothetical protein
MNGEDEIIYIIYKSDDCITGLRSKTWQLKKKQVNLKNEFMGFCHIKNINK